jgi:two-component system, NarL family, sensor kinase
VDARIARERSDERAEIAAALNDQVLQSLYGVTLRSRVVKEDLNGGHLLDLDKHVPELLTSGEVAVASLRRLVRYLTRSPVGHAGLAETLTLPVGQLQADSRIRFAAQIDGTVEANADVQLGMYLIAKEALHNAVKHAGASMISVSLAPNAEEIRLAVVDDGVGFDANDSARAPHPGIDLMKQRAIELGGVVEIRSRHGRGTTVSALIPIDIG